MASHFCFIPQHCHRSLAVTNTFMKKVLILILLLSVFAGCRNNKQTQENMYGCWEVIDILNDFYEPTGKKYVLQEIDGYFSNSATASSDCKAYVMLLKGNNDRITGKIVIDEYCNNTPDMTLNEYGSPAKQGSKIIDRANRKAYYISCEYGYTLGFQDMDDNSANPSRKSKLYSWIEIFRNNESFYSVTIKGEYQDEYRFTVNTYELDSALREAGLLSE